MICLLWICVKFIREWNRKWEAGVSSAAPTPPRVIPLASGQGWGLSPQLQEPNSPCPSPHSRGSSFYWQDKSHLSASSGSITTLQDLYTVDGIKTSLWTPKFINNQGEKKLGVWWRQDTCIFLLACQDQWESLKGSGWDASGRNTLWSRAEARGPEFLFSFLMKLSVTPDSIEVHPCAYDNTSLISFKNPLNHFRPLIQTLDVVFFSLR